MRYWLLLGAVVLGAVAYGVFYWSVAGGFTSGIATWVEARRAEGIEAGYAAFTREGFPFRVIVRFEHPQIDMAQAPPHLTWQAERLALVLQPWQLRHLIFDLSGSGRLAADRGTARHRVDYDVGEGLASYQVDAEGRLARLSADLHGVRLSETGGIGALLARAQLHARPGPAAALDVAVQVDDAALDLAALAPTERPLPAFGDRIALFQAELRLEGAGPFRGRPEAWLAAWRDSGGDLEVRRFKLTWGEVDLEATGTLALDEAMRPLGALTARVKGYEHLVDAAVAAGQMREKDGRTAKTVLGVLAQSAGGVLSVPVTLQDGIASLGPVPVARLAPLFPPAGRSPAPPSPVRPR